MGPCLGQHSLLTSNILRKRKARLNRIQTKEHRLDDLRLTDIIPND